jgi:outer membrane lipoprotein-sorting protein
MRWLLTVAVLALMAWPAAAQENAAEKLFRRMEKKLRTAKTVQVYFDSSVTIPPKTGSLKGTLILGDGDKLRLEFGGKPFGVEGNLTVVSDGTSMSSKDSADPEKDKTVKAPRALGANVRGSLLRLGVFICFNGIDRGGNLSPDLLKVSDFKLVGKEQVGERNTQVIDYTVTEVKDVISPGKWWMKMWLDAQTNLPVKLTMTMPKDELSDISTTTDTFSEFTIDAKVDAQSFVLPK